MKTHYKNIVIGFGKGGKTLADWLASRGEEVAVIEKSKKRYGGTCINVACIPTKSLIINAERGMSYAKARKVKDKLVTKLREKNYDKLAQQKSVTVIDGFASFISPHKLRVEQKDSERVISAERVFINIGTKPRVPKIAGIDSKRVYHSTSLMKLKERPKRLLIVGGGFIGLEFADLFLKFGSQVVVLDREEQFLPHEDPDIRESIMDVLEKRGLHYISDAQVERFVEKGNSVAVTYSSAQKETTIKTDAVLMATGRMTETDRLNLEVAGIERDEKGYILVDNQLRTTAANVWAIGDVNGGPQFTYISLDDFRIIKNQLVKSYYNSLKKRKAFATTVFITPPYSRIGLNETEAKADGIDYLVFTLSADNIPKAAILQQTEGLLKVLVEKDSGKILGAMLHCAESQELINTIQLAMNAGLRYETLRDQIYTHPSMTESFNDLFTA